MSRNLITRMGWASGVVAALVAAVFAVLVAAVRDLRSSTDQVHRSEQVMGVAGEARRAIAIVDLGARGGLADDAGLRTARTTLPSLLLRLDDLVDDGPQDTAVAALRRDAPRFLAEPTAARARALDNATGAVVTRERAVAAAERERAADKTSQAIALGIGGLIGSAVLIALLTAYLARYVVVPLRRTVQAAHRLSHGDLSARVVEEGDQEPLELARAFNQMAASLQESERVKDEFFALVSHELRTPLTSIIGYLELVLDDEHDLSQETRRFLEVVDRNAKRLLRLVGDMLFVAQVEAGRLTLERESVDLGTVAAQTIEAARPAAARAGVALELDASEVAPIHGDGDRLGQMLDNLVSNALKFSPEGAVVTVLVREDGALAVVEVVDRGVGIPADEQQQLFERFFRASTATRAAVPGAGLGLTIVRTIVEAHDGTIAVDSREGEGTTVRVELPHRGAPPATP